MAAISMDLRKRILDAYDKGSTTRQLVADRYNVSLGMVKKLLQQRRHTQDIAPRHHLSGRKPKLTEKDLEQLRKLVAQRPDYTLQELRDLAGLSCTIQTVHNALKSIGLTYKKRLSMP